MMNPLFRLRLDRHERVDRVVAVEVGELRQHIERVQIDQQVVFARRKTAARSSSKTSAALERHLMAQISRQGPLDVLVRQVQCLVEETIHLQLAAKQRERVN